jgi:hypothetical protein
MEENFVFYMVIAALCAAALLVRGVDWNSKNPGFTAPKKALEMPGFYYAPEKI